MLFLHRVSLFVRIVWRDFHGARIDCKTAWEVAGIIWRKP